jgi:NADH-quinone oxidoreductase subunit J
VLIYVGAVMVFMVYVIMLLDVRDPSYTRRFSRLLVLGIAGAVTFVGVLVYGFAHGQHATATTTTSFGLQQFAVAFLNEYWLHFELTSVLLVAAVVAAMAVIRGAKRHG